MIVHRSLVNGALLQRNLHQTVSVDVLRVESELVQRALHHVLHAGIVGHLDLSVSVVHAGRIGSVSVGDGVKSRSFKGSKGSERSEVTYLSLPGCTRTNPRLKFGGLKRRKMAGRLLSFRLRLCTGMKSLSSFSFMS